MATLSNEDLITRASVPAVKAKGSPVFKAQRNRSIGGITPTMMVRHPEKERKQMLEGKPSLVSDFPLLSDDVWKNLSRADKCIVLDVVSDIRALEEQSFKEFSSEEQKNKVLSKLREFMKTSTTHIQSLEEFKTFGHKGLEQLLEEMDKGLTGDAKVLVPSEEDLQIATILKMTGWDIKFENGVWNTTQDEAYPTQYAPKTADGKAFPVFSRENVLAVCKNLSDPAREVRIVPEKLMQVYREVFQRQMGEGQSSSLERSETKRVVEEKNQIFSTKSNAYKITCLTDADTILRDAQRMAMVAIFGETFGSAPKTKEVTDAMSDEFNAFSVNDAYSRHLRHMGRLIGVVERSGEAFDEMGLLGGYNPDYLAQYDEQIRRLEVQEPEGELLAQLKKSRDMFVNTVNLQKVFWQARIQEMLANKENIFGDELARTINESMGFAVMQNEGGFVMANGDVVKKFFEERDNSETFEELKAMLGKGGSSQEIEKYLREKKLVPEAENAPQAGNAPGQAQNTKTSSNRKYPEIFLQYLNDIVGMDFEAESSLLLDYSNLRLYQEMWKEDGLFVVEFESFRKEHPEATIDGFIKNFIEEQHPEANFNPELIEDAYYLTHKDGASQDKLNKAQAKVDAFNEQLLISDLILGAFTNDELKSYNLLDAKSKTALLQAKNKDALKKLEELKKDPAAYNAALDLAKKRHEAGIVGSVIRQKWLPGTKQAEQEAGVLPIVSSAIEKFIANLGQEQTDNNQYLINNGEPIVVEGQPQQEAQQQSSSADGKDTPKDPTFGDMYPSGPNVDQFLKRMKPYSAKAVKKNFIDKLLADLDNIKISRKAYYDRMAPFTSTNNVFAGQLKKPQLTEEQRAMLDKRGAEIEELMQRDFEASAFIPAAIMFQDIRFRAAGQPHYESAAKLEQLFSLLGHSDKLGQNSPYGIVEGERNTDVRDALRVFVLDVCSGRFKNSWTTEVGVKGPVGDLKDTKGSDSMMVELSKILDKYQVSEPIRKDIVDAFSYMTPELIAIALEPVITISEDKTRAKISPISLDKVVKANSDSERWDIIREDFDVKAHSETVLDLDGLVSTIYREKDGSAIDKKSVASAFIHEGPSTTFGSVTKSKEFQKKYSSSMDAVIREEILKAQNGQESAAPIAEDEGMELND